MKPHANTWFLVADSVGCRIYEYDNKQIQLIKAIEHPENKLKDSELTSDRPGRYAIGGQARGAYSQETDPKAIKIDDFSREMATLLLHDHSIHAFQYLIIAAGPRMMGLLMKHLKKQVKESITHSIEKDLIHFTEPQLADYLNNALVLR